LNIEFYGKLVLVLLLCSVCNWFEGSG